jgi:hypothetical protein
MTDEEASDAAMEFTRDQIMKEYADGSLAVKIIIEPRNKRRFMELWPDPGLRGAMVRLIEDHEKGKVTAPTRAATPRTAHGEFGMQAKALRLHINWMCNPRVWQAFGEDGNYLEWCKHQPCAYCKKAPYWDGNTEILSDPAHVRRIANGAGEALKPPFSAIPLCHDDHLRQHNDGESALGGKEWFDKQRIDHVRQWLWLAMKDMFAVDSMSKLQPELLLTYAEEAGIEQFLPDCYRGVS